MDGKRYKEITDQYADLRVAVIGDYCLDRYLEIDPSKAGMSAAELVVKLQELDTPIWTRNGQNHEENTIKLVPWALNDGEDKIVGEKIANILK